MAGARILVVDDNADNRTLLSDILLMFDYEILEAIDGEQGVAMAEAEAPDLILMDLSLPHMDGWTAAARIRELPALSAVPIIALTAHSLPGDRDRALAAGCTDYISKPIDVSTLLKKVTRLLA